MKKIICLLCLLAIVGILGACDNLPSPPEQYTVVFKHYDNTILSRQKVTANKAAVAPDAPTREGHTFIGWDKDFSKVTEDLEIYAVYEAHKFTVTFVDYDDTILKTEKVNYGTPATAPEAPTRSGYIFIGWDKGFDYVTADLTIKALYEFGLYTVQFVDSDGTVLKTEQVEKGKDATPPVVEDKPGLIFVGWDKDYTNVKSNLIITAQYDVITFTVTFLDYDDTVLKVETVKYGKDATPPQVERLGYTFVGWDQDYTNVLSNLTVKAQYEILTFTVQFIDRDGTVLKTETVNYGQDATPPTIDEIEGLTFIGWSVDYTNVTQDLIVLAQYEVTTFTVLFVDYDNSVLKEQIVEYGKSASAPTVSERVGYNFTGWDQDYTNVLSNLTIKAQYQAITYNIVYNANATKVAAVAWPNKEAFLNEFYTDLFNWIKDNASKIANLTVTNGVYSMTRYSLTATWSNVDELRAVDIYDFERTVGSLIYKPFTRVNDQPVIPVVDNNYFLNTEPYRSKYIDFDAYFLNCMLVTYTSYDRGYNQASNGRVQIFFRFHQWAKGTNIPAFDNIPKKYVTTVNESVVLPTTHLTYTIEDSFVLPDATCPDMTFLGWYTNEMGSGLPVTEIVAGTHGNLTLYAKWDDDPTTHKVIFLDDAGKVIEEKTIPVGGTVTAPTPPTKLGYQFIGWDKDITNVTSDMVVTARYQIIVYTITYHSNLDDEEVELPDFPITYTIHDKYTLPEISLEGYLFLGWYDNLECTGLPITETSYGNLELYACFIKIPEDGEEIGNGTIQVVAYETVVQVNRSTQIYAKIGDIYVNPRNVEFISTNENIATIDDVGFVRCKAVGDVVIIVITADDIAAIKISVVNEPHEIKWVGHQGSGGPVVQNTVSAFHEGGRRGYYAMECDVRVSADGVYYICHDDVFKSSLFVDSSLWDKAMAPYTWNQLKTFQVKDTYGGQTYYGYLATVEEYLLICKQYGAKAVLELKWTTGINSNDQSKIPGLIELVKRCGMYENAIFLSSMKNCLTYIRQNYPDANIQFLSGAGTTTLDNINWCIENKFSLDAPHDQVTSNFVNLMHNAFLYVNAYTVDSSVTANNLKNMFVDMITTNNLGV